MSLGLQYLLIALAVLASVGYLLKTRVPVLTRRVCVALAAPMTRASRPDWMRALGRRIAPPIGARTNCDGCHSACTPD